MSIKTVVLTGLDIRPRQHVPVWHMTLNFNMHWQNCYESRKNIYYHPSHSFALTMIKISSALKVIVIHMHAKFRLFLRCILLKESWKPLKVFFGKQSAQTELKLSKIACFLAVVRISFGTFYGILGLYGLGEQNDPASAHLWQKGFHLAFESWKSAHWSPRYIPDKLWGILGPFGPLVMVGKQNNPASAHVWPKGLKISFESQWSAA